MWAGEPVHAMEPEHASRDAAADQFLADGRFLAGLEPLVGDLVGYFLAGLFGRRGGSRRSFSRGSIG